jgi:D-sedoheptulose 7-phosphate isomerase
MNGHQHSADDGLRRAIAALQAVRDDAALAAAFGAACDLAVTALRGGGRLYTLGNGGSAADALHVAAELVGRIETARAALPAEALVADPVTLSALANDFGYEQLFVRQIEAKVTPRDCLLAFSTSGRSPNVVAALRAGRARGARGILFTGPADTPAGRHAEVVVAVGPVGPKTIQEVHRVLAHALCEALEQALGGAAVAT